MDKIAIIYMGGTFGCIGDPLQPMPAAQFLQQLQYIYPDDNALCYFSAPTIKDSSELNICDWLKLSQQIKHLADSFQQFIIIHGTDTLSYAAASLSYLIPAHLHVIITGSQYPLLEKSGQTLNVSSDAGDNLSFAVEYLRQHPTRTGVDVVFARKIYAGHTTYKRHTTEYQAFIGQEPTSVQHVLQHRFEFDVDTELLERASSIRLLNYYQTPSESALISQNLHNISKNPPHILILQCFGSANLPYSATLQQQLQGLIDQGCWVIMSSQVLFGALSSQYATGSWLTQIDVVFDQHHSQADLYARAMLLYLQHGQTPNWQQFWHEYPNEQ